MDWSGLLGTSFPTDQEEQVSDKYLTEMQWLLHSDPNSSLYGDTIPKGPSTEYVRTLVPNNIKSMAFETRVL